MAIAKRLTGAALAAGTAVAVSFVGVPAQASSGVTTIAHGLNSPRGLAFAPNGSLYVAEAGRGGAGPCFEGPEGGSVCFGRTGAVTKIDKGKHYRVLKGLPSFADEEDGTNGIGPSDIAFRDDGRMYVSVGLGADPARRAELPQLGKDASGWLLRSTSKKGSWAQVADIAGYEAEANPDGGEPDSNPNSVLKNPKSKVVADAGGNSLVRVAGDEITTLGVFEDRMVDAPPFLGLPPGTQIPMQSVPTSVVRGPDGAYYIGELTGFPFEPDSARVYRLVPGHAPTVYAKGFTNIIDIGWGKDGRLYVLEIAKNGLLSGDPTGALIKVRPDKTQKLIMDDGLHSPGGLALKGGNAYVSNCGTCAHTGTVLRIPLP